MEMINADICVIGGGSGGLSVAAGAAQMGAKTVLVEKAKMGGDCLNYGCVPSKALLAAAKKAASLQKGDIFGLEPVIPKVDFPAVMDHVHGVIAGIAPHDSVERFEGLGVKVIASHGKFVSRGILEAGEYRVKARRFVVATGSRAGAPPIPGLADVNFLTNETIFENRALPEHLIIIGGGPIGMEMAQAHRRLGARVTVLEAFTVLGRDDPELSKVVIDALVEEGVEFREGINIAEVREQDGGISVDLEQDGYAETLTGSHLLVAAGRIPNVEALGLEAAGIAFGKKGIKVDARLRTSNKKIFAIGDVAGGLQFTHVAGYHAGIVVRNALFRVPAKANHTVVPWVTYTDPEMAQVGMSEAQAVETFGDKVTVLRADLAENDRARAEHATKGLLKVMVGPKGRILGASLVGTGAGEIIQPWILAMTQKLKIGAMTSYIAPYPTMGEVNKRAAGSYYTPSLYSDRTKMVVRLLSKLG